ncbi:hypothetical protein ACFY72_35075 [Streptomyces globisporus]|uniref:hypothetical protein n=1 Tax=Streptomyces globisporus TaxID=1908 RepID=UPI0036CA7823
MRSTSSSKFKGLMATFLFASQVPVAEFATDPGRTLQLINEVALRLGPEAHTIAVAEVAEEYGAHPETAPAHMRACLLAVEAAFVVAPVPGQRRAVTR